MIFTTWIFALFLTITLACYWLSPMGWRKFVLIIAGGIFYWYSLPKYLLLIVVLASAVYLLGWSILKGKDRDKGVSAYSIAVGGVIACVAVLWAFKYLKLTINTFNLLLAELNPEQTLPLISFLAPLGISYLTFQFIHYLIDLYKGRILAETLSFTNFLTYTLFFPTLISGPIRKYQPFNEQLNSELHFSLDRTLDGMWRIIIGFGKKIIIADAAAQLTGALANPGPAGWVDYLIAIYAYSIQLYFDFSGYSDIAIGCGLLFGIKVPENFDHPYWQKNIADFWRKWHMTLGSWLREYIYIPLGGSRVTMWRNLLNLVIVMAICGLWHGAAWNYVLWGLWHGFGMALHRLYRIYLGERLKISRPIAIGITYHFVALGWIFFAAPNFSIFLTGISKLFLLI